MKCILLIISFFSIITFTAFGQADRVSFKVGYNFMTLLGKTVEVYAEKAVAPVSVLLGGGYTYAPRRGYILVDDNVDLESMQGAFLKLGCKYDFRLGKHMGWAGIIAIGSNYEETGLKRNFKTGNKERLTIKGNVFGIGMIYGVDFWLSNRFEIRTGLQFTFYNTRNQHIGHPGLTFQPGIGAPTPIFFPTQGIVGLTFKFPVRNQKVEQ